MTKPELKTEIITHLLGYLEKKSLLETNEKVCDFYIKTSNGKQELSVALNEVYSELVEKYNVTEA